MYPNLLFVGSTDPDLHYPLDLTGGTGAKLPEDALKPVADMFGSESVVIDPFCGMGYTARSAHKNGMDFVGNELNSVRAMKTIDWLQRAIK